MTPVDDSRYFPCNQSNDTRRGVTASAGRAFKAPVDMTAGIFHATNRVTPGSECNPYVGGAYGDCVRAVGDVDGHRRGGALHVESS
jgi:hypothetical protein